MKGFEGPIGQGELFQMLVLDGRPLSKMAPENIEVFREMWDHLNHAFEAHAGAENEWRGNPVLRALCTTDDRGMYGLELRHDEETDVLTLRTMSPATPITWVRKYK